MQCSMQVWSTEEMWGQFADQQMVMPSPEGVPSCAAKQPGKDM